MIRETEYIARATKRIGSLLVLLLLTVAGAAAAEDAEPDPRWQPWLGCWQPAPPLAETERETEPEIPAGEAPVVCIVPAADAAGVEIVTLVAGGIVARERAVLDQQRAVSGDDCTGWESFTLSAEGRRVYRQSEQSCEGGIERRESGVLAILPGGDWLDVQGVSAGGYTDVRVVRYRAIAPPEALGTDARAALQSRTRSIEAARLAAAARLTTSEVIEASAQLDPEVVVAWLIEREQGFALDARQLVQLADAGVPERVIDIMVALSYPRVFAIDRAAREGEPRPGVDTPRPDPWRTRPTRGIGIVGYPGYWGYPGYYGYGYGYGRGFGYPIIVLVRDRGEDAARPRGQAVPGRGYTRRGGTEAAPSANRPQPSADRSRPSPQSDTSAGSARSGTGRTAKPRPDNQ